MCTHDPQYLYQSRYRYRYRYRYRFCTSTCSCRAAAVFSYGIYQYLRTGTQLQHFENYWRGTSKSDRLRLKTAWHSEKSAWAFPASRVRVVSGSEESATVGLVKQPLPGPVPAMSTIDDVLYGKNRRQMYEKTIDVSVIKTQHVGS